MVLYPKKRLIRPIALITNPFFLWSFFFWFLALQLLYCIYRLIVGIWFLNLFVCVSVVFAFYIAKCPGFDNVFMEIAIFWFLIFCTYKNLALTKFILKPLRCLNGSYPCTYGNHLIERCIHLRVEAVHKWDSWSRSHLWTRFLIAQPLYHDAVIMQWSLQFFHCRKKSAFQLQGLRI